VTATPSTATEPRTGDVPEPRTRGGSLLRAELHRISARRMIRVLVALAGIGYVLIAAVSFTQFSQPTPALLAEAEQRRSEELALSQQFHEECLNSPDAPEGDAELFCGPPPSAEDLPLEFFLAKAPFTLEGLVSGAVAMGTATTALLFVIGATYAGAEWSSRSIVALLFWEPRRMKVMGTKIAVIVLAAVALAVIGQALWLGTGLLLMETRGPGLDVPEGFWGNLFGIQARAVVLVVLTALMGFGLANLTRNTGAALGIAFAYFVVLENAVRVVRQAWSQYLFGENAAALVNEGGLTIFVYDFSASPDGGFSETTEILLSNAHGAITLLVYVGLVVALGTILFQRRDLH
jgi:ABC-type transport system involved in multi-copper enzyme maturation permease subunit